MRRDRTGTLETLGIGPIGLIAALGILAMSPQASREAATSGGGAARVFAQFENVPVGIAVSRDGRVFLAFSRAIDEDEPFSVAEVKNGKAVPFPPGLKQDRGPAGRGRLLSVQALTVDARNRLWMLDCARIDNQDAETAGIKLVAVDLATNKVVQTIEFRPEVAGPTSFLNDVVIDLRRGSAGVAYLTDASPKGPNGIVVVDLASGRSRRRLNDHQSTKPSPVLVLQVEGRPLVRQSGPDAGKPLAFGADGIALSADGRKLYYSPITSHRWYRVDTDALVDGRLAEPKIAKRVEDLGDKGFAADGMLGSADGTVYVTDVENNAIRKSDAGGPLTDVVRDPKLLWPDSMALGGDGTLYFTTTQIERGKAIRGKDERVRPFTVWSVKTNSRPLMLGKP